jgi:replicative DNA helicase
MGKQIDKNNLGYLDLDFQYKLAKIFVEDSNFFEDVAPIVDQNAFTDPLLRMFVGTVKDYYSRENVMPSYEIINVILREKSKTKNDLEECDALIKKLRFETSFEGYVLVKDIALKFFKQQNLIKVANKILDIAGKGDIDRYDECQQLLDDAAMIGHEDDFGYNIFDLQDKALSKDYTVSIPTGIDKLDEVLGGGLDKGKLGLIIAPAGFGKTSFTTAIDSYAATYKCDMNNNSGFKVLQIYFEDDDVDITRKHYSRITQTEARFMKRLDKPEREEIAELLNNHADKEMLKENLRLKHFRTGTKSASDIEIYVKRLINSGFKPDLISIDYFECVAPEKGGYNTDTEWTREGVTMRKFENMAKELDCAIWIPTQGTKDSMNSPEVVRMDQASGSAKKVHVAQLIISIARAIGDIDKSRAVVSILKNRSGKSGKIFNNVYFNNGTCTISCTDTQEFDDGLAWEEDVEKRKEKNRIDVVRKLAAMDSSDGRVEGNYVGRINSN